MNNKTKKVVLLDFDGPVCSVFFKYSGQTVAQKLSHYVASISNVNAQDVYASDPLEILCRLEKKTNTHVLKKADIFLADMERRAVNGAPLSPGISPIINYFLKKQSALAIVSNNSERCVCGFLEEKNILDVPIFARPMGEPEKMKPNPHLLLNAISHFGGDVSDFIFIGDSVTDIVAANALSLKVIAFANKPHKLDKMLPLNPFFISNNLNDIFHKIVEWEKEESI